MSRPAHSPRRRTALLAAAGALALTGPGLVSVTVASPARAADPCLQETPNTSGLFPTACDDSTPPVTDQTVQTPPANVFGYNNVSDLTFVLHGHYTDADPDPMTFQCQFWNADTTSAPDPDTGTWDSCGDTPTTDGAGNYQANLAESDLADSTTAEYHLRVRAVDAGDSDPTRIPTNGPLSAPVTDTPDYDSSFDPSVQELTFKIDTVAPNTFLTGTPTDDIRPDWPMVTTQNVIMGLHSNEPVAGYVCTLNKKRVPCHDGDFRLVGLGPGAKTFSAFDVDRAGNHDPVPVTTTFSVPQNLSAGMAAATGKTCTTVKDASYFAGDYVQCTKMGAELHFTAPAKNIRELRLLAPAGPDLGIVEVNIGEGRWYPINLYAKYPEAIHTYLIRDQYTTPKGGEIRVRVKTVSASRPYVRVDAVLARD